MDLDLRAIGPDDLAEFVRTGETAFGHHADQGDVDEVGALVEYDRTLAACVADRIVGTAAALSLELTLPGLATVPAAGVTAVGVLPTHRRRGVLRALMTRQLDDVAARGEALAVLTAAEGGIYRRFGYGPAVTGMACEIRRDQGAFDAALPLPGPGAVRLVGPEEAALLLPDVFDRFRRGRPGEVSRTTGVWESFLADRERWREGASALFYAVHDEPDGEVTGYAAYRMREHGPGGFPFHRLEVTEVAATTPTAYASLWRFCLDVDLVDTVTAWDVPLDAPLRWLLADPRQLSATKVVDFLWVRIVDVAAALSARRYAGEGTVVLDVDDPFRPASGGRFSLEAGPGGAACAPTSRPADLALRTDALSAAFLGGVSFAAQAAAGRVGELAPGAVARADTLFACHPSPSCVTDF